MYLKRECWTKEPPQLTQNIESQNETSKLQLDEKEKFSVR